MVNHSVQIVYRRVDQGEEGGEFVTQEFAEAHPNICGRFVIRHGEHDPFMTTALQLLEAYADGWREEHLGALVVWLVNGPTPPGDSA